MHECIDNCLEAAQACEWCVDACADHGEEMAECIRLCRDVADLATLHARLMARDSDYHGDLRRSVPRRARRAPRSASSSITSTVGCVRTSCRSVRSRAATWPARANRPSGSGFRWASFRAVRITLAADSSARFSLNRDHSIWPVTERRGSGYTNE